MPDKITHEEAIDITHEEAIDALKGAYSDLLHQKGGPKVLDDDQVKDAMKEAFKELLDEKVTAFGYFSLKWIVTFLVGGLITFVGIKFGMK